MRTEKSQGWGFNENEGGKLDGTDAPVFVIAIRGCTAKNPSMITRRLVILIVLTSTLSARGELQLKGITMSEGQPLFSIYSTEDQNSKWIRLGQSFGEFKATEFDALSDTLTVQNGAARRSLKLESSTLTVSTDDRRAILNAQQLAVTKELSALNGRLVAMKALQFEADRSQRSDPKSVEEVAVLTARIQELQAVARELDRVGSALPPQSASFVQKITPPPTSP
jgi:hypothetical protein